MQEALAEAKVGELSTPTLNPGESYRELATDRSAWEDFDAETVGAKGLGFAKLNRLAYRHLLGDN